jgi:predicted acetyltransferase
MAIVDTFLELERLQAGDLELLVRFLFPGDPIRGWAPAYAFEMFLEGVPDPVGSIDLRLGEGPDVQRHFGNVGYEVFRDYRGRRLAARSLELLLPLARRHGFSELWITCDPDNLASRRTCEIVGAVYVDEVAIPPGHELFDRGERRKSRYRLAL